MQNFTKPKEEVEKVQHFSKPREEIEKVQHFTKPKEEVKVNDELEELKNMVHTTKNKLDKLKVEEPGFTGFDFRGSMNIKKNIIRK